LLLLIIIDARLWACLFPCARVNREVVPSVDKKFYVFVFFPVPESYTKQPIKYERRTATGGSAALGRTAT